MNVEKDGLGILGRLNKLKFRIYYSNYIKLKNNNYYSFNLSSMISSKNQPYFIYEYTDNLRGYEKYLIHGHSNIIFKNTFKKQMFSTTISRNNDNYFRRIKNIPFKIYSKVFLIPVMCGNTIYLKII